MEDDSRREPVRRAGLAMRAAVDDLAHEVTESVWRGPGYRSVLSEVGELGRYISSNMALVTRVLSEGTPVTDDDLGPARNMGETRALQGVQIDALLGSFRTGERAVVEQFCEYCAAEGGDVGAQRLGIREITEVLDRIEAAALERYRSARLRLAVHDDRSTGTLVARLASGQPVAAEDLDRVAEHLHIPIEGPFVSVAVRPANLDDLLAADQIRHHVLSRLLEMARRPVLSGMLADNMLFVVPGDDRRGVRATLERAVAPGQTRYEVVAGIAELSTGLVAAGYQCRQAIDAVDIGLRTGMRRGVLDQGETLIDVMLVKERQISAQLVRMQLGPLEGHGPLEATMAAYLAAGLSVPRAAAALDVHPNTVAYRLRRIAELTGKNLAEVDELVRFRLALRARELHDAGE